MAGEVEQTSRIPSTTMAVEFRQAITRRQSQAIGGELLAEQLGRSSLVVPVTASEMLNLVPMERLRFDKEPLPDVEWDQPLRGQALIVMDGQEQQRVTTYQLERMGLRCEVANDAEQAVNRIKEDWFDVVLWDAGKRDVSFVKAAQLLRSHFYRGAILGVGTPFLPTQREEFLAAGGDNLLPSPIVPAVWRHTLAGFLSRKMEMAQHSSDSLTSDFHADRDFLNLIRNYVAKLPSHLADMRAALQVADLARLARLSHALTDGGKLYGYPVLSDSAQKLEKLILQGRDSAEQVMQLDQIGHLVKKIENGMKLSRSNGYLALPGPLTKAA
ncbi:MAG: Hpt domain-containing protein [Gemmatales bacterium]